jgi:Guanylate kinase
MTTRSPRDGELDGRDYHFSSVENFEKLIAGGAFYEWALVHGRYYGTLKSEITSKLASGSDVILIIDVQGARMWREVAAVDAEIAKCLHSVFIRPQSLDVIKERMRLRGDVAEEIEKRLETARKEFAEEKYFERTIISGTRDEDYAALKKLYMEFKHL